MKPNLELIKEILAVSLGKKSPGERDSYLDQACRGNPELREQVESLLRAHEEAGEFLGQSVPRSESNFMAERVGVKIGRYKLLELIGEGGFGSVWMAEQAEPVRRRVALKVIKPGMDTKQVLARFESERQALARMEHPNIARVFDGGATDMGRPYFVMELVRGMPITEYCDASKFSMRERLDLFVQVCQAVQHAHQKGIIHRDLKPSNILVTEVDGAPVPKVIDFGVAKATQERLTELTLFTGLHQRIGTPAYMSPEQAGLGALDTDTRSDIYALGVLLYELLTGQTPLTQEHLKKAGWDEIFRLIREQDPPKPSTRLNALTREELTTIAARRQAEPIKLNRQLNGDLDWIVMKALEKDRRRRYETANGLAMDIRRHMQNEPVTACPPGKWYRFRKMVRRNKVAFSAGAAVAVSLILGFGISSTLFVREREARASEVSMRRQAENAGRQAQAEAVRAEEASFEARATLSSSDFLQGSRLLAEGHPSDALAFLTRSLSNNRTNDAALSRLTTLLAAHYWIIPAVSVGPANAADFSPDGKKIVTAADDGSVRVWDAQSGRPLTELLHHGTNVTSAQFSPDGRRILTVAADGNTRMWDAQSGQLLTEPWRYGTNVHAAQFSPDGKRILTTPFVDQIRTNVPTRADGRQGVVWSGEVLGYLRVGTIQVWDLESGQPAIDLSRQVGWADSAQFSPDGQRIVTTEDDSARVWNALSGQPLTAPLKHGGSVNSARFSPDGRRIVTACEDATAQVWDAQSGEPVTMPLKHSGSVNSAQFSPDGKWIATVSSDHAARIWEAQTGQAVTEPLLHGGTVTSAQFSPDSKWIVTSCEDGTWRAWAAQSGHPLTEPLRHGPWCCSARFSPDGRRIVTASADHTARVWNILGGPLLTEALPHGAEVNSAQFSSDGKRIVTASGDKTARVWDAQSGQPVTGPLLHEGSVYSAEFSPDGGRVVTASEQMPVRVWDARSGQPLSAAPNQRKRVEPLLPQPVAATGLRIVEAPSRPPLLEPWKLLGFVNAAHFSPDGKRIVSAESQDGARVWDGASEQPLVVLLPTGAPVTSVRFSPDGKRIVTASRDNTARVWDAQVGQPLTKPLTHGNWVISAQFSPDGMHVVTASGDKTARVWDAQTGELTSELKHPHTLSSAQFSPDGKRIVTASEDGTALVWDAQSGQALTEPLQHGTNVDSAQFSPDGKRVLTVARDGAARLWDAQTGQPLSEPLHHGGILHSAGFSPDGKRIVTASSDGTARVWDFTPSPANHPAWLLKAAEAIGGQMLNRQGVLEPTRLSRAETLSQIREDLSHQSGADDWAVWGRWFLADPATRTISPFSTQRPPDRDVSTFK